MDVSFLTSSRFWAMFMGVIVWYLQQRGLIGALEMQAISIFLSGFIGIRTVDRLGEKAGTTTLITSPNSEDSGK